jgi:hypothetical protein
MPKVEGRKRERRGGEGGGVDGVGEVRLVLTRT